MKKVIINWLFIYVFKGLFLFVCCNIWIWRIFFVLVYFIMLSVYMFIFLMIFIVFDKGIDIVRVVFFKVILIVFVLNVVNKNGSLIMLFVDIIVFNKCFLEDFKLIVFVVMLKFVVFKLDLDVFDVKDFKILFFVFLYVKMLFGCILMLLVVRLRVK